MSSRLVGGVALVCAVASPVLADEDGRIAAPYGTATAEIATIGVVAIHEYTASSPGHGIGLAVNFLPVVAGVGAGLAAEHAGLDPRPALAFHGALAGGLPLFALGAVIDGRDDYNAFRIGTTSVVLGVAGAIGGAYLGASRVQTVKESIPFLAAPFVGALGGGIVVAVVTFFDDDGPRSDGRLAKYAGIGGLLGTAGSLAFAFPDREPTGTSPRVSGGVLRQDHTTIISFGGAF